MQRELDLGSLSQEEAAIAILHWIKQHSAEFRKENKDLLEGN